MMIPLAAKLARIRLICFDVDGTLIDDEGGAANIWHSIHRLCGTPNDLNVDRFAAFISGRITYSQWVDLDMGDWQQHGLTRSHILRVVRQLRLMPGTRRTLAELRRRGYKLGVISGSLDIGLETLFPDHPFDEVYTNKIFFDGEGKLARWEATRFDSHGKPDALRDMARRHHVPLSRTAFVGDGENDIPLLGVAGCFVAFRPRSRELTEGADVVLRENELPKLLDLFK